MALIRVRALARFRITSCGTTWRTPREGKSSTFRRWSTPSRAKRVKFSRCSSKTPSLSTRFRDTMTHLRRGSGIRLRGSLANEVYRSCLADGSRMIKWTFRKRNSWFHRASKAPLRSSSTAGSMIINLERPLITTKWLTSTSIIRTQRVSQPQSAAMKTTLLLQQTFPLGIKLRETNPSPKYCTKSIRLLQELPR